MDKTFSQQIFNFLSVMSTLVVVLILVVLLLPIQVLTNWTITFPAKTYHVGDIVTVTNQADKGYNAIATTSRTIACVDVHKGVASYPGYTTIVAHPSGRFKAVTTMIVPKVQGLPAVCHIHQITSYTLFLFKPVVQQNNSANFIVAP